MSPSMLILACILGGLLMDGCVTRMVMPCSSLRIAVEGQRVPRAMRALRGALDKHGPLAVHAMLVHLGLLEPHLGLR